MLGLIVRLVVIVVVVVAPIALAVHAQRALRERRMLRALRVALANEDVAKVHDRLLRSPYWELAPGGRTIRSTAIADAFFGNLDAQRYDVLLADLRADPRLCTLRDAERAAGWAGPPLIADFAPSFVVIVEELQRRKGSSAYR